MRTLLITTLALSLSLVGCRSPWSSPPEEGPDAGKVGRGIHAWPGFESTPHGPGWRTDVLWPTLSLIRSPGDALNATEVLWPIYAQSSKGEWEKVALRPLYESEYRRPDADGAGEYSEKHFLRPLIGSITSDDERSKWALPFYSYKRSADDGHTLLFPAYAHEWSGETYTRDWIVPPLYAKTVDTSNGLEGWDLLFPLFHHQSQDNGDASTRALPLYWHEIDGDRESTVLFPFWWDVETKEGNLKMLFPLYGEYREPGSDDGATSIGGTLFISTKDGETRHTHVLFPLFHSAEWEDGEAFHVFPVLWHGERGDKSWTHVWPLYGKETDGDDVALSTVWPFFRYDKDADGGRSVHAPWPFVEFTKRADGSVKYGLPWPLFEYEKSESGRWEIDAPWPFVELSGGGKVSKFRAWPLIEAKSAETWKRGNVLWYGVRWDSDEEEDRSDFRVLWRLIERTRGAGKDTFVVNPLFRYETNDDGDVFWSALFGLLGRKREGDNVDWRFLWFF